MSGFIASARAIATRCIWPPESSVGLWSIRSPRPTRVRSSVDALAALLRRHAAEEQRHLDVLERRDLRQQVEVLEDEPDAAVAHVGELVARETPRRPRRRGGRCRSLGVSRQPMRFMSVDLPEPDGPTIATNSPGSIDEVDALQGLDLDLAGVVDLADASAMSMMAAVHRACGLLRSLVAQGRRRVDRRRAARREVAGEQSAWSRGSRSWRGRCGHESVGRPRNSSTSLPSIGRKDEARHDEDRDQQRRRGRRRACRRGPRGRRAR